MLSLLLALFVLVISAKSFAGPADAEVRVQQAIQLYRSAGHLEVDKKLSAAKELCWNPSGESQDGLLEILKNETDLELLEGSARCLSWMGDLNAIPTLLTLMSQLPERAMKRLPSVQEIILPKKSPQTTAFNFNVSDQIGFAVMSIVKRYPLVVPKEIEVAIREANKQTPSPFLARTLTRMEERKQVKPESPDDLEYTFPPSQF